MLEKHEVPDDSEVPENPEDPEVPEVHEVHEMHEKNGKAIIMTKTFRIMACIFGKIEKRQ